MKPNQLLRRERELRGWSQARVAQEIGTDPASISRWERGASFPYPYFREKLCALFAKDAAALGLMQESDEEFSTRQGNEGRQDVPPPIATREEQIYDPAIPLPAADAKMLIGREALLSQLKGRLCSGEPGALTVLHGLPGVGKTALAIALAHDAEVQAHFRDGILWAGVGPSPDRLGLLSRWGARLGITSPVSAKVNSFEDWVRTIHNAIGRRQMLLVIDDAWEIEDVLAFKLGGPQCAHLVTTRIPQVALHVAGEGVLEVPELSEQDSLSLLSRFVPGFVADDPEAALPLVNAVGGLPLALTLIGKYLRVQSATGQPRRLYAAMRQVYDTSHRLHLSEPLTPVDAHPSLPRGTSLSLHSIIAVSEQYIDEDARQALRMLAIFPAKPNSFSEEAALAVCQVPVEVLDTLCDAGLVESRGPRRYTLHQTIADYARVHLMQHPQTDRNTGENLVGSTTSPDSGHVPRNIPKRSNGDAPGTREEIALLRLVEYMVRFVEDHTSDYNLLEQESRNILLALEQAFERGYHEEYVQGVRDFVPFLRVRGLTALAVIHLRRAYTVACTLENYAVVTMILFHLGQIAVEQGENERAEAYLREGLALARRYADNEQVSLFLLNIGEVYEQRGEDVLANRYLREGLELARNLGHWVGGFSPVLVINQTEDEMCLYFSELPHMMGRNYLASIDALFDAWQYGAFLLPEIRQIITSPDGHIYGVPRDAYTLCLVYNRRLFAEAGLDPDQPPTTWDAFRAVASRVTNPRRGIAGFAETTISNQGGWHFTNWLYTAGVEPQQYQDGSWVATFHHPKAVQLLEMFKEMRFVDGSMSPAVLLHDRELFDLLAQGQIAMAILTPKAIYDLYESYHAHFADFGLAPMPQNGGNACLLGGHAYVYSTHQSPETLKTAFDRVTVQRFDETTYEEFLRVESAAGRAVGLPWSPYLMGPLFTGAVQEHFAQLTLKYVNVPMRNYSPYMESKLELIPEPRVEAQKYYALIDPILQAVLTDPAANPQRLLDRAVESFQKRIAYHLK